MFRLIKSAVPLLMTGAVAAILAACGTVPAVPDSVELPTGSVQAPAEPVTVAPAATAPAQPTSAPTAAPAATATSTAGSSAESLPAQFNVTLSGTVGNQDMVIILERTDATAQGQYFFKHERNATGFEQFQYLNGTIAPDGSVKLQEPAGDNGSATMLTGTLQLSDNRFSLTGTWSSPQTNQPQPVQLAEVLAPQTSYTISTKTMYATSETPMFTTYRAAYPQLSGAGAAGSAFNNLVESTVSKAISQFKTDVEQISPTADLPPAVNRSTIEISYETTFANNKIISVLFRDYSFVAGAAHPNSTTFTVNYDLANNREIALADLFAPNSDYLAWLSKYSLDKLRTRGFPLFEEGAAASAENFRSWNLEAEGLRITFDPYQVAAYAAGPQVLFIPYRELQSISNPQGPIAAIAHP
ncbi:MAG TPA: DUF3298 and DUF4163 domain-containing protein [Roseiflexaceae bacterium]|nr:DUF3298 and DUF4163 domain-containing protein [Roseiflexaceae bacterium]